VISLLLKRKGRLRQKKKLKAAKKGELGQDLNN